MAKITGSKNLEQHIIQSEGHVKGWGEYEDVTGKVTSGYGDTLNPNNPPKTKEEALGRLRQNISLFEGELSNYITRDNLTQEQMDALIDLAFNVGTDKLIKNGLLDAVNRGDDEDVLNRLGQYTKARSKDTGQLTVYPGLVKRSQARVELWSKGMAPVQAQQPKAPVPVQGVAAKPTKKDIGRLNTDLTEEQIIAAAPDAPAEGDKDQGIGGKPTPEFTEAQIMAAAPELTTDVGITADDQVNRRRSRLDDMRVSAKDVNPNIYDVAIDMAGRLGINVADAQALLEDPDIDDHKETITNQDIATTSPKVAEWAAKRPENYALLKKDSDGLKKIEQASTAWSAVKTVGSRSIIHNQKYLEHTKIALGISNQQQGIKELKKLEEEMAKHPLVQYKKGQEAIQNELEEFGTQVGKLVEKTKAAAQIEDIDADKIFGLISTLYKEGKLSFLELTDLIKEAYTNPAAFALIAADSMSSAVSPLILRAAGSAVGAGIGFFTPIPLGAASGGTIGGTIGGAAVAYGSFIEEKIQESGLSVEEFYSDPKRLAEVRKAATRYGLTMGVFDGLRALFAGRSTVKAFKAASASSKAKKAAAIVKGVAKDQVKESALEFTQEATARVAAGEGAAKAITEGTQEVLFGQPAGVASTALGVIPKVYKKMNNRQKAKKFVDGVEESIRAKADREAFEGMRKAHQEAEASKSNPNQTEEFVREATKVQEDLEVEVTPDIDAATPDEFIKKENESIEQNVETQIEQMADPEGEQFVRIRTDEWEAYFTENGVNPFDAIHEFSPEVVEQFANARETNGEVKISLAEFLRVAGEDEELSAIVRFSDNKLNDKEATEALELYEKALPELFDIKDEDGPQFDFSPDKDGDVILRPVELTSRFRSNEEREVRKKLEKDLRRVTKGTKVEEDAIPLMAEIQFRHLRFRSEILDRPIKEVADIIKFRERELSEFGRTTGQFEYKSPEEFIMRLSPEAKLSTFIHEFGHSWLTEVLIDHGFLKNIAEDKRTEKQQQYWQVMQDLQDLLNIKDLSEFMDEVTQGKQNFKWRQVQETFAQTTEKYFLEGKFKDSKVKRIMLQLQRWLQPFAQFIAKSYPHFPPLKITPQVERVFDTIFDATKKVEDEVYSMFPEGIFDPETLGVEGKRYQELLAKVRDEAIGDSYIAAFVKNMKEREKQIDAALDRIYEEAEATIDARPSMQIWNAFKQLPSGAKITNQSFFELFGEDVKDTIPRGVLAGQKRAGRDALEVIHEMGIEDPQEFLKLLQEASIRDTLIDEEAKRKIDREFPAIKTDEQIHKIVVEKINSDGREKILRTEMKILSKKHLAQLQRLTKQAILPPAMKRRMAKENVKAEAQELVLRSRMKGFKAESFLTQSQKHGRDAAMAWGRSDIEGAFNSKQLELVYFEAYREARKIERVAAKGILLTKRILKAKDPQIAKAHEIDGYHAAQALATVFAMGKGPLPLIDVSKFGGPRSVYSDSWEGQVNMRIMEIERALGTSDRRYPDVEISLAMFEVLSMIKTASHQAKTIEIEGKAITREVITSTISEEIGERKKGDPKKEVGRAGKLFKSYERFRETMSIFFKTDEEFEQSLLGKVDTMTREAEANYTRDMEADMGEISQLFRDRVKAKGGARWKKILMPLAKRNIFINKLVAQKQIYSHELGVTFESTDEILVFLLNMGSESNLQKLLLGGRRKGEPLAAMNPETNRIDDTKAWEFINRMVKEGVLIKEDFELAQGIWNIFKKHYGDVKAAHRKLYGFDIGKIEARSFTIDGIGTFEGGYYPLRKDSAYQELTRSAEAFDVFGGPNSFSEMFPHSNMSLTKSRSNMHYPISLSLSGLHGSLQATLQLKHLKVPMFEFGKIFGSDNVINALENRRPGAHKNVVVPHFARTMAQQYSTVTAEDNLAVGALMSAARLLRRNARRLWFMGNVISGFKQFLGIVQAASKIPPRRLMKMTRRFAVSPIQSIRNIRSLSNRMDVRFKANEKRLINSYNDLDLNGDWVSVTQDKIDQITFFIVQHAQNITDAVVWMAAQEQAIEKGLTEKEAISFADNTVEKTQGTSSIAARSAIQQTNDIYRLITDFSTVPLAQMHQQLETFRRNMDEDVYIRFRRQLGVALAVVIVPSVLISASGQLKDSLLAGEDRDEEEDDLALNLVTDALDIAFPVVGRHGGAAVEYLYSKFAPPEFDEEGKRLKRKQPRGITLSPALSTLSSVEQAVRGIGDASRGVDMLPSDFAAIFDAATILTGIPLSPIARGIRMGSKTESEKDRRQRLRVRRRQLQIARRQEEREQRR